MGYPGDPELLAEDIAHIFRRTDQPCCYFGLTLACSFAAAAAVIFLSS